MILIIGGGKSSEIAAEEVIHQGEVPLRLVLPEEIFSPLEGVETVKGRLLSFTGMQADFLADIETDSEIKKFNVGAAVIAVDETPKAADSNCITLSSVLENNSIKCSGTIVILLNAKKPSRSSHIVAVEKAIEIKDSNPDCRIYIITPEVRTFGLDELEYCRAQKKGIIFIRAENIRHSSGEMKVTDSPSGKVLDITPDLIITDEEQEVKNAALWAKAFSINLYEDGHFRLGNVSRGPVTSMRNGVFLCGTASRALLPREMDTSARAAATRAVTAAHTPLAVNSAEVDEEKCASCMTCVRVCLFHAPSINERGKSEMFRDLCQACGLCVNLCPASAISLKGSGRIEVRNAVDDALRCLHE